MRPITISLLFILWFTIQQTAMAQDTEPDEPADISYQIKLGIREVDGNNSAIMNRVEQVPIDILNMKHGLPFELLILRNNIPDELIGSCWVALADSGVYEAPERSLIHQCDYLSPGVFGLVIVGLTNGEYVTKAFSFNPTWSPEEKDTIPNEHPLPVFPETENPEIRTILVDWWNTVVLEDVKKNFEGLFTLDRVE